MEFELFYRCRFATKRDVERVEFEPLYSCRLATHRVWACSVSRVDCSTCRLCVFWLLSCGQQFLVQKTWEMLLWLRRADLLTMVGLLSVFSHILVNTNKPLGWQVPGQDSGALLESYVDRQVVVWATDSTYTQKRTWPPWFCILILWSYNHACCVMHLAASSGKWVWKSH